MKEGIGSSASVSAAFGPASLIYLGNPGSYLAGDLAGDLALEKDVLISAVARLAI